MWQNRSLMSFSSIFEEIVCVIAVFVERPINFLLNSNFNWNLFISFEISNILLNSLCVVWVINVAEVVAFVLKTHNFVFLFTLVQLLLAVGLLFLLKWNKINRNAPFLVMIQRQTWFHSIYSFDIEMEIIWWMENRFMSLLLIWILFSYCRYNFFQLFVFSSIVVVLWVIFEIILSPLLLCMRKLKLQFNPIQHFAVQTHKSSKLINLLIFLIIFRLIF